jgi:hypothetical protein
MADMDRGRSDINVVEHVYDHNLEKRGWAGAPYAPEMTTT